MAEEMDVSIQMVGAHPRFQALEIPAIPNEYEAYIGKSTYNIRGRSIELMDTFGSLHPGYKNHRKGMLGEIRKVSVVEEYIRVFRQSHIYVRLHPSRLQTPFQIPSRHNDVPDREQSDQGQIQAGQLRLSRKVDDEAAPQQSA